MICIVMAGVRIFAEPLHMSPAQWPTGPWLCSWVGPGPFGTDRARVANELDGLPGKHLVLVRYTATHQPGDEWVYNEADPDHAKTVWAREMDPQQNQELLRYYSNRDVWLVQPDVEQGRLTVYPDARVMQAKLSAAR